MVRLVCISDTHNQHHKIILPPGDILVHAGDFTGLGSIREFTAFAHWLLSYVDTYKHIILVPGNHDFIFERNYAVAKSLLTSKVNVLVHDAVELEGIKFFGSSYTPPFMNWAFMKPESELSNLFHKIPLDTQVLITHGPAYRRLDRTTQGKCVGSKALRQIIDQLPNLHTHIFGHIHESHGVLSRKGIDFFNVSCVDEVYRMTNKFTIIDC